MQHGLSGQHVLLDPDEIQLYARVGLEYMLSLKPVGALETGDAQLYFEDRWCLHRILSVENDLFFIDPPKPGPNADDPQPSARKPGVERQVNAFREEARNIDLISRYETRLMRNSGRLMEEIRALRAERAKTDTDLVYDEQTDPAAAWYRKLLAQAERIAAARAQSKQGNQRLRSRLLQTQNQPLPPKSRLAINQAARQRNPQNQRRSAPKSPTESLKRFAIKVSLSGQPPPKFKMPLEIPSSRVACPSSSPSLPPAAYSRKSRMPLLSQTQAFRARFGLGAATASTGAAPAPASSAGAAGKFALSRTSLNSAAFLGSTFGGGACSFR
jgi:hypothetical protein